MGNESALFSFDRELDTPLCGVDEAGRGPLAGPVFAACAVLRPGAELPFLNDSKKLTEARREELFRLLTGGAAWYGIGAASPEEIDRVNILQATFLAMGRAVEALGVPADYALIDGNRMPPLPIPGETIVKGDAKSASVAAASILAKVSRDRVLRQLDQEHPEYGFGKHKGYGTKAHYQAIKAYGLLPEHRRSFLKNLEEK